MTVLASPAPMESMPESLREIQETLGPDVAQRIKNRFAGIRVFIPKRLAPGHRLVQLLGEENARRLSHHFGGETLFIPRDAKAERTRRNREIIVRYDAGTPVRLLAQIYRLTERQIYAILSAPV